MKKELWVGIGVGGGATAFTLIVSLIIQMSGDRPDYSRAIAYSLLAGGGGFLAGSLGAFWALSDDEVQNAPRKANPPADPLELPHPVDALSLLGETPAEQWDTIARHSAASHPTPPRELVGLLEKVSRAGSAVLPEPAHDNPLPSPVVRQEEPAIAAPARRWEPPVIERIEPEVKPSFYGVEEEDFWTGSDSMSGYDEPEEEDIFGLSHGSDSL